MRILHVLDHSIPLHSGYTFRSRAIIEQQRALGWETDHITSPKHNLVAHPSAVEEDIDGLHFFRTEPSRGFLARLPILNQAAVATALERRLVQAVEKTRPDVLHAHSPALNGMAAVRVGRRLGVPVVYEVRAFWEDAAVDHGTSSEWGLRYRMTRALETWVLRRAHHVTTICQGLRDDIIGRGIAADKVTVIPNAVDVDKFSIAVAPDAALLQQLGLAGKTVLGFIGSFYAYEGLPLLLQALAQLLREREDIAVVLVGGGPEEARLKTLADDLKLGQHVVFTGRVPHDEVRRYYDLVDIFVYPRLRMRLTDLVTPLKPLEAMAQGRVVAASDVGGHRELIRPGENGYLFEPNNPAALAHTVQELCAKRQTWPELIQRARRFVETERSWPVVVARYRQVYEGLLAAQGPRP